MSAHRPISSHFIDLCTSPTRYPPIAGLVVRDGRRRFFVPAAAPPSAQRHRPARLLHRRSPAVHPPRRRGAAAATTCSTISSSTSPAGGSSASTTCSSPASRGPTGSSGWTSARRRCCAAWGRAPWPAAIVGRQIIDWTDVQYLASAAPVQLKVSYDRLAELQPGRPGAHRRRPLLPRERRDRRRPRRGDRRRDPRGGQRRARWPTCSKAWTRSAPPTSWRR